MAESSTSKAAAYALFLSGWPFGFERIGRMAHIAAGTQVRARGRLVWANTLAAE